MMLSLYLALRLQSGQQVEIVVVASGGFEPTRHQLNYELLYTGIS